MVWEVQVGVIFLCFWGVCFKIVFWSSWGRFWGRFGDHFGIIIGPKSKKKRDWFWDRFSVPRLAQIIPYSRAGRALGDPSYARVFNKKKWKGSNSTRKGDLNKKKAQLFLSLFRLLLTFAYHCSDYCWILTFTSSCWWSDTPWAVARRIYRLPPIFFHIPPWALGLQTIT